MSKFGEAFDQEHKIYDNFSLNTNSKVSYNLV